MSERLFHNKGKRFIRCFFVFCLGCWLSFFAMKYNTEDMNEQNTGAGTESEFQTEQESESELGINSETEVESESEVKSDYERLAIAGKKTVGNLLLTALQPVGKTMYVWGGGWNEADTGAGIEAITIGVSSRWAEYAMMQDATYDYRTTRFQIHDGLDCSGYVGWCIYNVMETESGKSGYVLKAKEMAKTFSERGWGTYTEAGNVTEWKAGDIMSSSGHVWIVIGTCEDKSVVLIHSSPPGVRIAGTTLPDGTPSEATKLAEKYMSTYYPNWYEKYQDCKAEAFFLTSSASMRWNRETLLDEENLTEMSAEEVLEWMFFKQE